MRVEELVCMDVEGDFRTDVQLSDFNDPAYNLGLIRNYIFTTSAPVTYGSAQRIYSAKDVLDTLKSAFSNQRVENRFVLTANYGHGKSHLALVLANFFARPVESREVNFILQRLEQALNNSSVLAGYRDLKESKGEFLVVRMQGDTFEDLQEGFIYALEQSLKEHDSTRDIKLALWYQQAMEWLKRLDGEQRERAEVFLANQNTDLSSLMQSIAKQGSYALVRELGKHINGVYPDFGREINLEELVIWTVNQVCVPNNLGGLLILFDEFSLFLQKYMNSRTAGKLQELLNGITKCQGKSVFLAFSQQDVNTVADTYAKGQRREDVKKELERLPKDKRASLYSLMESVLAAYLKQDNATWELWSRSHSVKPYLSRAREIVLEHFAKRYTMDLNWNVEAFDDMVVKGCFPLHPLTTAILSVHNFETGTSENPRTALQFVRRVWADVSKQPAELPDGRPNFIYPVALVDFFGEQLSKRWHSAYLHALESAPETVSEEQRVVLQALFVQAAVDLKAQAGGQIELLVHLSGLRREDVKQALKDLAAQKIIQSDSIRKMSSLWPPEARPQEVEEVIQEAVKKTDIDFSLMEKIISGLNPLEITTGFGHASDWSPRQIALTADMFTVEELKTQIRYYRSSTSVIEEGLRGLIIWLVAQNEDEKMTLRRNAENILTSALGDNNHPLPVIVVLPRQAVPDLVASAQRLKALENLTHSDREKIGSVIYQQEKVFTELNFKSALKDLVGTEQHYGDIKRNFHEYAFPEVYRTSIQALKDFSLKSVITECYRQAYPYRVEFYTQYPVSGKGPKPLRTATQTVARWLLGDTAGDSIPNLPKKDVTYQLSTFYLTQKWGLMIAESYKIKPPTALSLQESWDLLDKTFPEGCNEILVRQTLIDLHNPPYGHDYNTLILLLSAWIGFHQHELRLSLSGRIISLNQLKNFLDDCKTPQEFLNRICCTEPLAISRSTQDELFGDVAEVLEKVRQVKNFTILEAEEALTRFEQALTNPLLPEAKREEIEQTYSRLEEDLNKAREYDQKVSTWRNKVAIGDFEELLRLCDSWKEFPVLSLVLADQPTIAVLREKWESAMQSALEVFCAKCAKLNDLGDFKEQEKSLKKARKELEQYPVFIKRIDDALQKLSKQSAELKKLESEKAIIAYIDGMAPSAALRDLYKYRQNLSKLTDLSSQTAARRDKKFSQIESRIQQYEQIATELPIAIAHVARSTDLRPLRDVLMRNLEQVQDTPIYPILLKVQNKINTLEIFFQRLGELNVLPKETPEDLNSIEALITSIESEFPDQLDPTQLALLEKKKHEIKQVRQDKERAANAWLNELKSGLNRGENIEALLHKTEKPHAFLNSEDQVALEQLKIDLQRLLENNVVLQIEILFNKIKDPEVRRHCLEKLQGLMDK